MTRPSVVARSPEILKAAAGLLLLAVGGLYLSGWIFLWAIRAEPQSATPLTPLLYWYHHGEHAEVRRPLLWSLAAGMGMTLGAGLAALVPRRRSLHGDARFASRGEIRRAGLFGREGIILGRLGNSYLMLPGQQGVLLEAPPRSGKGVGVVVPNLLNWPGSVVCDQSTTPLKSAAAVEKVRAHVGRWARNVRQSSFRVGAAAGDRPQA